jgi:hypothetical protein
VQMEEIPAMCRWTIHFAHVAMRFWALESRGRV